MYGTFLFYEHEERMFFSYGVYRHMYFYGIPCISNTNAPLEHNNNIVTREGIIKSEQNYVMYLLL